MNEKTITISREEYEALIRAQERIEVVERLISKVEYISTDEIAAVLGIRSRTKEAQNEAV